MSARRLPSWFPTAAEEERAAARGVVEAPMRPFSPIEDQALRAAEGRYGAIKPLAIALQRLPAELYRRRQVLERQRAQARGR